MPRARQGDDAGRGDARGNGCGVRHELREVAVADEHEHIDVQEVPLSLLWSWVEQRKIEDLKSLALVFALKARRPELFVEVG